MDNHKRGTIYINTSNISYYRKEHPLLSLKKGPSCLEMFWNLVSHGPEIPKA